MEIRPHVCTALAACLTDEPIFDVGEPDIVRPLVGADDRDRVAALVIQAINRDTANAGFPHFPRMCETLRLDLGIPTGDRDTWPGDAEGRVALKQGFGPPQPAGNIAMTFFTKVP